MSLLTRSLIPALALALLASGPVAARDTKYMVPLQEILDMPEAKEKLDGSVRFYLKGQPAPNVRQRFDEDVSNKKTNGVGKDDLTGCKWAALSALIAFQATAKQKGANAVIDLVSYYKRAENANPTAVECHAGAVVIGVALKGRYARVSH
jgi:hypothetical protein